MLHGKPFGLAVTIQLTKRKKNAIKSNRVGQKHPIDVMPANWKNKVRQGGTGS